VNGDDRWLTTVFWWLPAQSQLDLSYAQAGNPTKRGYQRRSRRTVVITRTGSKAPGTLQDGSTSCAKPIWSILFIPVWSSYDAAKLTAGFVRRLMHKLVHRLLFLSAPMIIVPVIATSITQQNTNAPERPGEMINRSEDPLLANFRFRSIGPASMGGRIDDIAVSESDPNIIYIAYAVGGVFKSENNGTTFQPVFETYPTASIGDIAIHPTNPNIVYIGTGEANNRQTSSFGDGIYKTVDGGKTFTTIGLKDTQTIARIVIDPKNPETVYVAAPGHLFGPNEERGIFKTTDGGRTWNKVKYVDKDTGFTDIVMDPVNNSILYAASYQRRRSGCCFDGGGPGSAIWKTEDAGRTWTKLNGTGLPPGTYGRIALDVSRSSPNVVYAQIQAGETGTVPPEPARGGARGGAGGPGAFDWCNNGGPNHGFTAARGGPGGANTAAANANTAAANANPTPPALDAARGGVFRSENKGAAWILMSNCNARPMYFSQLRVDPSNDKTIYVAGLPVSKSLDSGKTFASLDDGGGNGTPGHVDQHAIWIDPRNPKHLMIGNDGGLDVSWDQGKSWDFVNTMATALAYWVSADMRHPYYVYTGLQDNGTWGGPSSVRGRGGILNSDWFNIGGGDGFQTAVDPEDYNVVYTESQDGNTNRYDLRVGRGTSIRPRTPPVQSAPGAQVSGGPATPAAEAGGEAPPQAFGGRGGPPNVLNAASPENYRFNWNTPFMLSPHNSRIMWFGGNRLFKSYNRGETWVASADLTKQVDRSEVRLLEVAGDRTQLSKNDGVSAYSTIISVSESPVLPGVVWAGTDDGNLQVSKDGGTTFTEVGKNLPGLPAGHRYWISRIDASHFDAATAYVAVDGHRSDDLKPYIFVTHDYGQTFQNIANTLPPSGNVQVVREDPKNKDLLFAGTEFGLFVSLNGGRRWERFMNNYPTVRTDDILIHPRDGDLVVASHGRSIWIVDDIAPLQQLTPEVLSQDVALFDIRPAIAYLNDQTHGTQVGGQKVFVGENGPRGAMIHYYLKNAATGDVKISIADATGKIVRNIDGTRMAGINRVLWNLTANGPGPGVGGSGGRGGGPPAVEPGTYLLTLAVNGKSLTKPVNVLQDRWLSEK